MGNFGRFGIAPGVAALAVLAGHAAGDVYSFTVNAQASSLREQTNISTPLTGTFIGSYDATANPGGTQTRAGLFGGTGNQSIPITGSLSASGDTTMHPTGSFALDLNTARSIATISSLNLDYLAGQHPSIALSLGLMFQTFHTINPAALFIGNIPLNLPLADLATVDSLSVEQIGGPVLARLTSGGSPGLYQFSSLVPVRVTVSASVLGMPVQIPQPLTLLVPFNLSLNVQGTTVAATATADVSVNQSIPGPLYTIQNQAIDLPTIIPPGQTAHLLLNGQLGDLAIGFSVEGAIQATGHPASNACPADFNGDGRLNVLDIVAYMSAFAAHDLRADFNGDGRLNVLDAVAFFQAYAVGCAH